MTTKNASRYYSLDIVRIFAFCCIVAEHFFLCTSYYDIVVQGTIMYIATLIRTFCMICVPIFLMLSGYLMRNRKPNKQHYLKLSKIIVEYILASLCCAAYDTWIHGMPDNILLHIKEIIFQIFSYEVAPYSWYVEMYIGLFLLIPYLNMLYDAMNGQKEKQKLILTLLLLTSIPGMTNIFGANFGTYSMDLRILPQGWLDFYPVTFYLMGIYLREYPLKLRRSTNLILILLTFVVSGTVCYLKSYGGLFILGVWQPQQSGFAVIQAVLVFTLLSQFPFKPTGILEKLVPQLSNLCFSAYLVSSIFDLAVYTRLASVITQPVYRLEYFLVTVPLNIVLSLALSAVIQIVYRMLHQLAEQISKRRKAVSEFG